MKFQIDEMRAHLMDAVRLTARFDELQRETPRALGDRGGDSLTLSNRFAKIELVRDFESDTITARGDCTPTKFIDPVAALVFALRELALFVDGRAD